MRLKCPSCRQVFDGGDSTKKLIECPNCGTKSKSPGKMVVPPTQSFDAHGKTQIGSGDDFETDDKSLNGSFGDYDILNRIAEGGMGVVYKARHRKLNRIVALKTIRGDALADRSQLARFESESKAAAQLDHPGIVPVYEAGEVSGRHFIAMAYVDGKSLHERVAKQGPLSPVESAQMMKQVAEAVAYAHSRGVVHRDLKPANILLAKVAEAGMLPYAPKVTDFGLARFGDSELTVSGQVIGTPSYMPPEQALGRSDLAVERADVYSLGATLYFVLTGNPPFRAATPIETIQLVVDSEPAALRVVNSSIPRDLETICHKCLRKNPNDRYTSAAALAADLGRWLDNRPIVARPVRQFEKVWLWCRRRPAVAAAIAIVLLTAITATIIIGSLRRQAAQDLAAKDDSNNRKRVATLVENLTTVPPAGVPATLESLEPLRELAIPALKKELTNASLDAEAKLHLRLALARFETPDIPALVAHIRDADHEEFGNLLTAYRSAPAERVLAELTSAAKNAEAKNDWVLKARIAIDAMYLGDASIVVEMCQPRPDPIQRTTFVATFPHWRAGLAELVPILKSVSDESARAGILCALAEVPQDDIKPADRDAWRPLMEESFSSAKEGGTHSAAEIALRRWEFPLPERAEFRRHDPTRNWYVNSQGMTLVKVHSGTYMREMALPTYEISGPIRQRTVSMVTADGAMTFVMGGAQVQEVVLTRSFFVSAHEVPLKVYREFMSDKEYPTEWKPAGWKYSYRESEIEDTTPAPSDWVGAVKFCNWLSQRESLAPAYQFKGSELTSVSADLIENWERIPDANGYRLLFSAEWEIACRAGTTTSFSFGEDESFQNAYAVCGKGRPEPSGRRLPNAWGLFDVHGNLSEWCQDSVFNYHGKELRVVDPIGYEHLTFRSLRGGYFAEHSGKIASYSANGDTTNALNYAGFRIMRPAE